MMGPKGVLTPWTIEMDVRLVVRAATAISLGGLRRI